MKRRTARLIYQAMVVAMFFWPVVDDVFPLWVDLAYLVFLGATVAELAVIYRFGEGSAWRQN